MKMYVYHVYIFFSLVCDETRLCAKVLYFSGFFELLMVISNIGQDPYYPIDLTKTLSPYTGRWINRRALCWPSDQVF
jgi:hypothetical protein